MILQQNQEYTEKDFYSRGLPKWPKMAVTEIGDVNVTRMYKWPNWFSLIYLAILQFLHRFGHVMAKNAKMGHFKRKTHLSHLAFSAYSFTWRFSVTANLGHFSKPNAFSFVRHFLNFFFQIFWLLRIYWNMDMKFVSIRDPRTIDRPTTDIQLS